MINAAFMTYKKLRQEMRLEGLLIQFTGMLYYICIYLQHTHTETDGHFYIDAGVRLMAVGYYPLCEVAQYLQEWHGVLEAQPANCMETMQHVGDIFSRSRSIASLRGLRLNAG